jgi:hypothetical protein
MTQTNKERDMTNRVTVAEMIEALSRLPQDAELVITESGYYSYSEFADIMLPEAYTVEGVDNDADVGKVVYRIGHSHQSY